MTNGGDSVEAKDLKGERLMPGISLRRDNDEFVRLGFLQGDGCLGRLKSNEHLGLEINIGHKDDDIFDLFDIRKEEGKHSYYTRGYNDRLMELGFSSNDLPYRGLPDTIDTWSNEEVLSFLRGLYSANGSVIKGHRVALKSTCKDLVIQVKNLLDGFDINPYITTNKSKKIKFNNGEYKCRESYDLNIS